MGFSLTRTINTWLRDYNTSGMPGTGIRNPPKSEGRTWGTEIEMMVGDLYQRTPHFIASMSGTNSLSGGSDPQLLTEYYPGLVIEFVAPNTSTGSVTINVDTLGTTSLCDQYGVQLGNGQIYAGLMIRAVYDGDVFRTRDHVPCGFKVDRNNSDQTGLLNNQYSDVNFTTPRRNIGDVYDLSTDFVTPRPGRWFRFSAIAWWRDNAQTDPEAAETANHVLKLTRYISGVYTEDIAAGEGWAPAGFPNTAASAIPGIDVFVEPNDSFKLIAYSSNNGGGDNGKLDGNPAHTWFSGVELR